MKIFKLTFIVLIIISVKITAQSYGLGNSDPALFSNFRLPDTKLHKFWIGSNFSFQSDKEIHRYNSEGYDNYRYYSQLSLNPQYYLFEQTDDKSLSVDMAIYASYYNQYQKVGGSSYYMDHFDKQMQYNLQIRLNGNYKKYQELSDLFFVFEPNIQLTNSEDNSNGTEQNNYSFTKNRIYEVGFGIGFGKLRDVTPVVSAIRLQERLKLLNIVNKDLDQSTIEKLSERFSYYENFSRIYDRGEKHFWKGIEDVLSADGISLGGLNQFGDSFIKEIPNEIRFARYEGLTTGIEFQFSYTNERTAFNGLSESLTTMGKLFLNYSHQLNLVSQFAFNFSLSGGPNLIADSPIKQQYICNAGVSYDYELTDRIMISAMNNLNVSFRNSDEQIKDLINEVRFTTRYFLEDWLSLNATYQWMYVDQKDYFNDHSSNIANNISIGFVYYFDKGIVTK